MKIMINLSEGEFEYLRKFANEDNDMSVSVFVKEVALQNASNYKLGSKRENNNGADNSKR